MKQHAATRAALPFSDTRDFDDAAQGFLGTRDDANVVSESGRVVWSLEQYGFLSEEEAAPTVNPSLWRQARLNMHHGLFEVVPGVYQVRGFDLANMTLIEGDTGVIVFDTLTSIEGARAAMELYFEHRGRRPVIGGHLLAYAYRSLGRRARRPRRRDAGERPRSGHRAGPVHGICRFREPSSRVPR